ncbi:hypothetical protein ACEI25_000843 [Photobacterium damselae]
MKKIVIAAIISTVTSSAYAVDTAHTSQATASWYGTANIIPSDAHTITGKGGIMKLEDGTLNLQADGTFTSTPIVMESHKLDTTITGSVQDQVAEKVATDWNLETASFDWGVVNTATANEILANLVFMDELSGKELTLDGTKIVDGAEGINVSVSNSVVPKSQPVNPAEEAHVEATFVSTYITSTP